MKTNQMMLRKMVDLEVFQRTDNGLYNLTGLVEQYNNTFPDNKKQLTDFLRLKSTKKNWKKKLKKSFLRILGKGVNQVIMNIFS